MEKTKFIFLINAERQYQVLIRLISTFSRCRISISEMNLQVKKEEQNLTIQITAAETKENAIKLSKRLNREIDILSVHVYEHINSMDYEKQEF